MFFPSANWNCFKLLSCYFLVDANFPDENRGSVAEVISTNQAQNNDLIDQAVEDVLKVLPVLI